MERIIIASIGTVLLSGGTYCVYKSAKDEMFKNIFTNTVLLVDIICTIAFPISMIFC